MNHSSIIKKATPFLVRGGRPTRLIKSLHATGYGKTVVLAMFQYYIIFCEKHCRNIRGKDLNPNINIEDYRWEHSSLLQRLRKAGL